MQYVVVEPSRLPTTNVLVQIFNFQTNTTSKGGILTDSRNSHNNKT